jgi:hypothetical protein
MNVAKHTSYLASAEGYTLMQGGKHQECNFNKYTRACRECLKSHSAHCGRDALARSIAVIDFQEYDPNCSHQVLQVVHLT